MPSLSLKHWTETAALALDGMEAAHRAIAATAKGRRHAAQQLNQSYLMLLSSHFQQFCRGLHFEAVRHLTSGIEPVLRDLIESALIVGRKLDQGNPNPGNLGSDFGTLGMKFWPMLRLKYNGVEERQARLAKMTFWRNAIAHRDFTSTTHAHELGGRTEITLQEVRAFRSNCDRLARYFDAAVLDYVKKIVGSNAGW